MKTKTVDATTLRKLFNEAGLYERSRSGEIQALVTYDQPAHPRSGQPPGTRSQLVTYYENGKEVATVHQFELKDGSLGASELPDPKEVVVDGVHYILGTLAS
jgi:hypothetical protein